MQTLKQKLQPQKKPLKASFLSWQRHQKHIRDSGIDPANASAKSNLKWIQDFQASVKKGINPNEIKGIVKNAAGQPIAYASIRVKDTAAENLTNAKGEFKFEIPQGSEVLIISAKGYNSQEIPITKSRVYNVNLAQ